MPEYVDIEVLASLVVMMRAGVEGAILLSNDDEESRFYECITHDEARVISAPHSALALLRMIEGKGIQGVAAAVRGGNSPPVEPNVFQPSVGDTTSILLLSNGSEKVIRDICGAPWVAACQKEIGSIHERAVWLARIIEQIRHLCAQHGVPPLQQVNPQLVIDWQHFTIGWVQLTPILLDLGFTNTEIESLKSIQASGDLQTGLLECDGMEVVHVISAASALYRPRGIASARIIDSNSLVSMLRVAFDPAEFEHDDMFWRVRLWERANVRYPFLREWRLLDPLGVVWDQRYWEKDLSSMLEMLRDGELLAMFKMDLDDFKSVNEALGHAGGDQAIRFYCEVVKRVLGGVGEIYRRGGDEVVVLAPNVLEASAQELAEETRASIEASFRGWSTEHGLHSIPTASIGLALGRRGQSSSDVSRLADEAQRQSKQQGKNCVVFLR